MIGTYYDISQIDSHSVQFDDATTASFSLFGLPLSECSRTLPVHRGYSHSPEYRPSYVGPAVRPPMPSNERNELNG